MLFGMNSGRFVLTQVLDLIHRQTLDRLVTRYDAESRVRHFGCRQQLICMAFAQLTWREGLRDIADCLNARPTTRYHLGFREPIAKSTLADANEQRDWRLWEALAKSLMRKARPLYAGEDLGLEMENTVYALKVHLRIKHYYGTSPNAVKTQIWIAVCVYLMVAIIHKQLNLPGTLHRTLQMLSVHPFEKVPLNKLLTETDFRYLEPLDSNQLMLWNL